MNIIIISRDRLWVDSLCITLDLLLECEITCFTQVTALAERALLEVGNSAILLMDSAIPGVDYWELSDWLNINFEGNSIILTSSHSYNIHGARMMRHGCFAVICKTKGFSACWRAIQSARNGQNYFID